MKKNFAFRFLPLAAKTRTANPFVEQFQKIAAQTVAAAEQLMAGFRGAPEEALARICEIEHVADEGVRETHRLVDRTFIAPYDKRDIVKLANRLDDIVDALRAVARFLVSYRALEANDGFALAAKAIAMCELVLRSAARLKQVVDAMPSFDHDGLRESLRVIDGIEDEGDEKLAQTLREVFVDPNQPLTAAMLAWRDIFRLLERTTDYCAHAMNVILSIARQEGS